MLKCESKETSDTVIQSSDNSELDHIVTSKTLAKPLENSDNSLLVRYLIFAIIDYYYFTLALNIEL